MSPEIWVTIISIAGSALGWIASRVYFRKKYLAELEELRAKTDQIEKTASLSTVQAADLVARSAQQMLAPMLERISDMNRQIQELLKGKEEQANEIARLRSRVATLEQENMVLKEGLNVH